MIMLPIDSRNNMQDVNSIVHSLGFNSLWVIDPIILNCISDRKGCEKLAVVIQDVSTRYILCARCISSVTLNRNAITKLLVDNMNECTLPDAILIDTSPDVMEGVSAFLSNKNCGNKAPEIVVGMSCIDKLLRRFYMELRSLASFANSESDDDSADKLDNWLEEVRMRYNSKLAPKPRSV